MLAVFITLAVALGFPGLSHSVPTLEPTLLPTKPPLPVANAVMHARAWSSCLRRSEVPVDDLLNKELKTDYRPRYWGSLSHRKFVSEALCRRGSFGLSGYEVFYFNATAANRKDYPKLDSKLLRPFLKPFKTMESRVARRLASRAHVHAGWNDPALRWVIQLTLAWSPEWTPAPTHSPTHSPTPWPTPSPTPSPTDVLTLYARDAKDHSLSMVVLVVSLSFAVVILIGIACYCYCRNKRLDGVNACAQV